MISEPAAPAVLHAWALYLRASEEARRRGDRRTGTEHLVLATLEDSSVEALMGVDLQQAREALRSLDRAALDVVGVGVDVGDSEYEMRQVPKKPRLRDVARGDHPRLTPVAKKVLEDAVRPNRRKSHVTAHQVLNRILRLQPPDPAAVMLGALDVDAPDVLSRLDLTVPQD